MVEFKKMRKELIAELEIREQECLEELEAIRKILSFHEEEIKEFKSSSKENDYLRKRQKMGLTQKDVAVKAGVGVSTVFKLEHDVSIRPINLKKISDVLGINIG